MIELQNEQERILTVRIRNCITALTAAICLVATALGQQPSTKENQKMTHRATGSFDVKVVPQKADSEVAEASGLTRMTIDKQFHGVLEATSKGEMLASRPDAKGSGGYVALERVTGTLNGRRGSFVLQHSATMTRGVPNLSITVVPDSGTDELTGLTGKLNIIIGTDGKHEYEFEYAM